MRPPRPAGEANEGGIESAGAMADLLLGTTGILLVVLVALGPAVFSGPSRVVPPVPLELPAEGALAGHEGRVMLAVAAGLVVEPGATAIPVSEIATSVEIAGAVSRAGSARLLLVVAPDGVEAAFHAGARLATLGVVEVDRVRVNRSCAGLRRAERRGSALVLVCEGR